MTDKEMALQIGARLIKSQFRVAALSAELSRHHSGGKEIPRRGNVEDTLQRSLSHDFQSRIDALYRELDEASSEDLLRTLYSSIELQCGPE